LIHYVYCSYIYNNERPFASAVKVTNKKTLKEEKMPNRFADDDRLRRLADLMSSGNAVEKRKALRQLRLAYRNGDRAKRRFIVSLLYSSPASMMPAEAESVPPAVDPMRRWMRMRVENWPADMAPPTEQSDWNAAQQYFGTALSRDAFRKARECETPREWRTQGPRRAKESRKAAGP
jgi:hypothetical protein